MTLMKCYRPPSSGGATDHAYAFDAEALYYRTFFWDVALVKSNSEGSLIVSGIYTN
jgi:hypothetical protein